MKKKYYFKPYGSFLINNNKHKNKVDYYNLVHLTYNKNNINMGFFQNAINSISNAFGGARQFVSDVYGKVKDVGNGIAKGFDWVSSTLDTISNNASSIPFIGSAIQEGISDLRVATDFDSINKWIQDHNKMLQNNPYEGIVSDFANKIQSGLDTAKSYAPQVESAFSSVGLG